MKISLIMAIITITTLISMFTVNAIPLIGTSFAESKACPTGDRSVEGKCITAPIPVCQKNDPDDEDCKNPSQGSGGGKVTEKCLFPSVLVDGQCQSKPGHGPNSL